MRGKPVTRIVLPMLKDDGDDEYGGNHMVYDLFSARGIYHHGCGHFLLNDDYDISVQCNRNYDGYRYAISRKGAGWIGEIHVTIKTNEAYEAHTEAHRDFNYPVVEYSDTMQGAVDWLVARWEATNGNS